MAERINSTAGIDDTQPGIERAKTVLFDFASAAQSTAASLANEQRHRAARQVGGIADAVRLAARSLDHSQTPAAARYADRAADQIGDLARWLHQRQWAQLVGDVEAVARRSPALFILGAVAAGFLAGRFLALSAPPADRSRNAAGDPSAPADAVAAAVSSASGNGKLAGWTGSGPETREIP